MVTTRFDRLTRSVSIALSRRTLTGTLVLSILDLPSLVDAKKKKHKRKKHKKVKRNTFGCVDVGKFCTNGGQCCSGICQGKKDKKKCEAHDASTCQPGQDSCTSKVACTTSTGFDGQCFTTTGNGGYCAAGNACTACASDADCAAVLGAGAACVICDPSGCGMLNLTTVCKSPTPD